MAGGQQECVYFGSAVVRFSLVFRQRKHIGITVKPDLEVVVAAPEGTPVDVVRERVQRRAPWILRQLDQFERFRPWPAPRQYLSGETHSYLGRQYRLKVVPGQTPSVKLLGRYLTVETAGTVDTGEVRRLVEEWYRVHARAMFKRRMELCREAFPEFAGLDPPLLVRRLKTRWGSCSKTGRILLNTELVKTPVECIDYVIAHEMCHLKVRDHSAEFYRLLSACVPDWQRRKERLERVPLP